MDLQTITKCGLLHDIGKACQRADNERRTHSAIGGDFIKECMEKSTAGIENLGEDAGKMLLHSIRYHHGRALVGAHLKENDLAYIVYEADNIAAGSDRREKMDHAEEMPEEGEEESQQKFDSHACLANIFNIFEAGGSDSYFALKPLDTKENPNYPGRAKNAEAAASTGAYSGIRETLRKKFEEKDPLSMSTEELLRILEDTLIYIPSSTNMEEVCDISLYDHVKMTGAVAAAMLRYFGSHEIHDYKKACFSADAKGYRDKKMFLLVSGDFSGIQKFIYRIPNKGAMRMLRGRSFYLEIGLENMIDTLLEHIGLSRANLIYSGGGHFYMLTDNTDETKRVLSEGFENINRDLLTHFGTTLYLAGGWAEASANDLMAADGSTADLFKKVSRSVSEAKQKRYDAGTRNELFTEQSTYNAVTEGQRECGLCHRSIDEETLQDYEAVHYEENGGEEQAAEAMKVCPVCNALYHLGKVLVEGDRILAVVNTELEKAVPLPSPLDTPLWLAAVSEDEAKKLAKESMTHLYDINGSNTSEYMKARIWTADYAAKKDEKILDFAKLAEQSGEGEEGKGIKRLGVLRADVDWLGAAFIAGLPKTYATLSRYAALSRSLAMFFKFIIKKICEKELPKGQKPFYLFQDKGDAPRNLHVVYAGGDDLFLVGAWDDLLEMAVDLRRTFDSYTNGKLSFSAGLGLFSPSYPISRMADLTGELEDIAKSQEGKDHIVLWGSEWQYSQDGTSAEIVTPCFSWKDLTENVAGEKLKFLVSHFRLDGISDTDENPLPAGKSMLYKLLTLIPQGKKSRFNLARFAYALARMEPDRNASEAAKKCYSEVRTQLYTWGISSDDRKELAAALNMIIYRMRDK